MGCFTRGGITVLIPEEKPGLGKKSFKSSPPPKSSPAGGMGGKGPFPLSLTPVGGKVGGFGLQIPPGFAGLVPPPPLAPRLKKPNKSKS